MSIDLNILHIVFGWNVNWKLEKRFSKAPIPNHKTLQLYHVFAPPPPYLVLELKKIIVQSPPPSREIKTLLPHKKLTPV